MRSQLHYGPSPWDYVGAITGGIAQGMDFNERRQARQQALQQQQMHHAFQLMGLAGKLGEDQPDLAQAIFAQAQAMIGAGQQPQRSLLGRLFGGPAPPPTAPAIPTPQFVGPEQRMQTEIKRMEAVMGRPLTEQEKTAYLKIEPKAPPQPTLLQGPQGLVEWRPGEPLAGLKKPATESKPDQQLYFDPNDPTKFAWGDKGKPAPIEGYVPKEMTTALTGMMTTEEIKNVVKGIANGTIAPSQISRFGKSQPKIMAEATKQGVNVKMAEMKYREADAFARNLYGSPRMIQFMSLGRSVVKTIDEAKRLAAELELGGIKLVNRIQLEALVQTAGNTPMGQLAGKYITIMNGLRGEMAQLEQGGYAPTDPAWKVAQEQLDRNYGVKMLHGNLDEIAKIINYRFLAYDEMKNAMQVPGPQVTPPNYPMQPKGTPPATVDKETAKQMLRERGYPIP